LRKEWDVSGGEKKMMGTGWTGSERFKRVGNSDDTIIIVTGATIHTGGMARSDNHLHTHAPLGNDPRRALQKDITLGPGNGRYT
jgi:hypothetical protein